jgi:hypothetical protein
MQLNTAMQVPDDAARSIQGALLARVPSDSAAVRSSTASALAALALAQPAIAARLLQGCLDSVTSAVKRLSGARLGTSTDLTGAASWARI